MANQGIRRSWRIAVLPGDGIGSEVVGATLPLLRHASQMAGLDLNWDMLPWPSTAWHEDNGQMMPDDALAQLGQYDAMLMGALGDPGPTSDPNRYLLSDGVSLSPLLTLRKGFDLWACERPAQLLDGAHQYLADARARDVDMLVIRENSEGEYVNQGGRLHRGTARETATQLEVFTRTATERLLRHAFESAQRRASERQEKGEPRHFTRLDGTHATSQVCLITKRNALPEWGELYTEVFEQLSRQYPDVATHHELIDAACMKFVQAPWQFDVVAASNLQGDILTDLAAILSGGMGVAPSCNLKPDDRSVPPLFEPTHGSAPDIAGQHLADPTAMILTAAMMLDWMGVEDPAASEAAEHLRRATEASLKARDEGSTLTGTDNISQHIEHFLAQRQEALTP